MTETTTTTTTTTTCYAARTGEGYWTCDVVGGCPGCRSLARSLDDQDQLDEWNAARAAAR